MLGFVRRREKDHLKPRSDLDRTERRDVFVFEGNLEGIEIRWEIHQDEVRKVDAGASKAEGVCVPANVPATTGKRPNLHPLDGTRPHPRNDGSPDLSPAFLRKHRAHVKAWVVAETTLRPPRPGSLHT